MNALPFGLPALVRVLALPDEELLRVAGDLRRRPRLHRPPRDVPPISLSVLAQSFQEQPTPQTSNAALG